MQEIYLLGIIITDKGKGLFQNIFSNIYFIFIIRFYSFNISLKFIV